ncbi:MAG TPA: phosphoribosylformylglycinamidine synthase subunit PurS [Nitrososphaeraceae archaeon]
MKTQEFKVIVTIENKPFINDPEGETIYRELLLKNNYKNIKSVRTAKVLKLITIATNSKEAVLSIIKMREDLRIFNPLVSNCQVNVVYDREETNKDV